MALMHLTVLAGGLAEVAVDVVRSARILRVLEDLLGGAGLDDVAWRAVSGQEEGTVIGDPLGLLHVVGHDDHGHLASQFPDRVLDPDD